MLVYSEVACWFVHTMIITFITLYVIFSMAFHTLDPKIYKKHHAPKNWMMKLMKRRRVGFSEFKYL